ncbi:MAG: hypothetical protein AB1724_16975 [Thermodesulfobacteriota bacterium]
MKCPKCDFINPDNSGECRKCGVISDKISQTGLKDSAPVEVNKSKFLPRKSLKEMYKEDADRALVDMLFRYILSAIFFIVPVYLFLSNSFSIKWYYFPLLFFSFVALALGESVRLGLEDYNKKREFQAQREAEQYVKVSADGRVQCSKCGCFSVVTIPEKHQSGVTGGILLDPLIILSSGGGDSNLINVCQHCGHQMRFRENVKNM